MTKNKPVRMEIRFDPVEDKEMIDFIDRYGSTRAGFIKQVLKMYKNQFDSMTPNAPIDDTTNNEDVKEEAKRRPQIKDISFSSKDM